VRKLKAALEEERRRCKALTNQIAAESKPRFGRQSSSGAGMRNSMAGSMNGGSRGASANGAQRMSAPAGGSARASATGLGQRGSGAGASRALKSLARAVAESYVAPAKRNARPPLPCALFCLGSRARCSADRLFPVRGCSQMARLCCASAGR
jgi:hypothetical protein